MINMTHGTVKLFCGNACPKLAKAIADRLEIPLGDCEVTRFSDGEVCVNIKETVRGCDVFVIQSTSTPVNDNLMELLVMIDALKRASCNRLTVVMPYFGYARQDRKARARDPITAKLVANMLEAAGADRLLTMDLHSTQLQGFFDIPVDNLLGMPVLTSVARSRAMAAKFNAPLAIIDKRRPKANVMEVMNIIGDVEGKICLMLDDMIDTAGTITQGAAALKANGAKEVYACCSHGVLSGPAIERLNNSAIKKVVILDTIEQPAEKKCEKIQEVTVSEIFAEAIARIYSYTSISTLFE